MLYMGWHADLLLNGYLLWCLVADEHVWDRRAIHYYIKAAEGQLRDCLGHVIRAWTSTLVALYKACHGMKKERNGVQEMLAC
jgi:hypothetical protein